MSLFHGVYPALVTPFTADGKVSEKALAALVRRYIAEGMDGVYVTGSTGECHLLSEDERRIAVEAVCAEAKGKLKTIVHVGAVDPVLSHRLAKHAALCGADALSAVTPFYYKYGFPQIKQFYADLAAETELPFVVYNIPSLSGVTYTTDQIKEFAEVRNIVGIKHTSPDFFQLERVKAALPDFTVFNGFDEMFLCGLAVGADGGIGSTYCLQGPRFKRIETLFRQGKNEEALQEQHKANDLIDALLKTNLFSGMKYLLTKQGIDCGSVRAPMRPLTEDEMKFLDGYIHF